MNKYVSVVLPTHNEEKNILPIINEIIQRNKKYDIEIIIVDDNSTDNTEKLIRDYSKKDSRVRLISRIDRFGLSSAIKEGCLNAKGDIIAVMDSDGQHEVKSLIKAIDLLFKNSNDLILGEVGLPGSILGDRWFINITSAIEFRIEVLVLNVNLNGLKY